MIALPICNRYVRSSTFDGVIIPEASVHFKLGVTKSEKLTKLKPETAKL